MPHFSPFPPIVAKPNVPPSDEEKEQILEKARHPVLSSTDPDIQLAWAQDVLAFVATSQLHEDHIAINQPKRPATPEIEHQLRVDATNIVNFLADQHHPKAEFMRGMWLEFGNFGVRQDKREAFRSYARAAEQGYARAEYRMGMQFEQNNDPVKALIHYQRGAEAGDSASNYVRLLLTSDVTNETATGHDDCHGTDGPAARFRSRAADAPGSSRKLRRKRPSRRIRSSLVLDQNCSDGRRSSACFRFDDCPR
jgi:hypothetical protein